MSHDSTPTNQQLCDTTFYYIYLFI